MGLRLTDGFIFTAVDYFEKLGISEEEIDWDETGDKEFKVFMPEYELLQQIIACEVGYWALLRVSNSCQSNSDTMVRIRREKITKYEAEYRKYEYFNEDLY